MLTDAGTAPAATLTPRFEWGNSRAMRRLAGTSGATVHSGRGRLCGGVARAAFVCVALLVPALAARAEALGNVEAVIPAGQDELLAQMLGRAETLPGECRFAGGGAERGVIRATYSCPSGEIVFELRHPDAAPGAPFHTVRFAITPTRGTPPPGFADALLARIRAREAAFEWRQSRSIFFWLSTLRVNGVLFALCAAFVMIWNVSPARLRQARAGEIGLVFTLTAVAAVLRFVVASANLINHGGIPYARLLRGDTGYLATAQFFALFYALTARDIEHAILFNRIVGTLTIPVVYVLCRSLQPDRKLWPATAAFLFAVCPLHIMFSASDALAVFSCFLAATSYALLAGAARRETPGSVARICYLGGFAGLALLTQVRPEHVLFLFPAALFLLVRRRALRAGSFVPPLAVGGGFIAIYTYETARFGLSYASPPPLWPTLEHLTWPLILNPIVGLPVLCIGTLAVWAYTGPQLGALAVLPWIPAVLLPALTTDSGHHAARVYANWLILILPVAGYGFSRMLTARKPIAPMVAALALVYLGVQPITARDLLAARYLDIVEHERFKALVTTLPAGVTSIVVPDDEVMARRDHATLEVFNKYAMITESVPNEARSIGLVRLTDYLEQPQRTSCVPGACAFFYGLPCMEPDMYPVTGEQCRELLRTHRTSILEEATVVGASFTHCSIYTGRLRRLLCDPAVQPRQFVVYRIEP
jgi:hypothetical protein